MSDYDRSVETAVNSTLLLITGWISAVMSLFAYPFIFGASGVIMGILSTRKNNRAGLILITTSMAFMTAGLLLDDVLWSLLERTVNTLRWR